MNLTYEFDLLGGKGLPPKSGPTTLTLVALTVSVPLITAIFLAITYTDDRIALSVKKKELASIKSSISTKDKALQKRYTIEKQIEHKKAYLAEVQSITHKRQPWSPIVTTIARNLPEPLILNEFDASFKIVQQKVPSKSNPHKKVDIRIPTRNMKIHILTKSSENSDTAVKEYQNNLLTDSELGSQLNPITISREARDWVDNDVVHYELDCTFKTE